MIIIEYVKKYYWVGLIVVVIAIALLKIHNADKVVEATVNSSQTQIESLKKEHSEEIKKRDILIEAHQKELKSLEDNYNQKSIELEKERNKKIKIIIKYYDDPQKLASKIIDSYGFEYVK